MSTPDGRDLVALERIRDAHWQRGTILVLAQLGDSEPVTVRGDWVARGPEELPFA